jgi:hypothetical protein
LSWKRMPAIVMYENTARHQLLHPFENLRRSAPNATIPPNAA